jgi:hypothetical protein
MGSFTMSGPGVIVGFISGLFVYVVCISVYASIKKDYPLDLKETLLPYALLSAIIAGLIEIQVGIAITATKLYFWIFLSVLVAYGLKTVWDGDNADPSNNLNISLTAPGKGLHNRKDKLQAKLKQRKKQPEKKEKPLSVSPVFLALLGVSFLSASILFTQGFEFISNPGPKEALLESLWRLLTTRGIPGQSVLSLSVPMLLFITYLSCMFLVFFSQW